jgi:hypothetical protein
MLGLNFDYMKHTIQENLDEQINKLRLNVDRNNRDLLEHMNKLKVTSN